MPAISNRPDDNVSWIYRSTAILQRALGRIEHFPNIVVELRSVNHRHIRTSAALTAPPWRLDPQSVESAICVRNHISIATRALPPFQQSLIILNRTLKSYGLTAISNGALTSGDQRYDRAPPSTRCGDEWRVLIPDTDTSKSFNTGVKADYSLSAWSRSSIYQNCRAMVAPMHPDPQLQSANFAQC